MEAVYAFDRGQGELNWPFYREVEMGTVRPTRLAVELDYYRQHARDWAAQRPGQYVVIKNTGVLGFYPDFEAAYRAGAGKYGLETDFLVKQILEYEPVFIVL
jgi:hypothetical protein